MIIDNILKIFNFRKINLKIPPIFLNYFITQIVYKSFDKIKHFLS